MKKLIFVPLLILAFATSGFAADGATWNRRYDIDAITDSLTISLPAGMTLFSVEMETTVDTLAISFLSEKKLGNRSSTTYAVDRTRILMGKMSGRTTHVYNSDAMADKLRIFTQGDTTGYVWVFGSCCR